MWVLSLPPIFPAISQWCCAALVSFVLFPPPVSLWVCDHMLGLPVHAAWPHSLWSAGVTVILFSLFSLSRTNSALPQMTSTLNSFGMLPFRSSVQYLVPYTSMCVCFLARSDTERGKPFGASCLLRYSKRRLKVTARIIQWDVLERAASSLTCLPMGTYASLN